MKYNYPIKYAAMPIVKQVGWIHGVNELERDYGVVCYIVSKCYIVSEKVEYEKTGESAKNYEVVFLYQYNDNRYVWEKSVPSFNLINYNCTNSDIVEKVFNSYEEALVFATIKNNKLCEKTWTYLPYNSEWKQKVSEKIAQFENMLAEYKVLEKQILNSTSEFIPNKQKVLNKLISIKDNKGKVISYNIYDYLNSDIEDENFVVYSIKQEVYNELKENIENETDIISSIEMENVILYHLANEQKTIIINPNIVGTCYLNENKILNHSDEVISIPNFDDVTRLYTTETLEEIIASFKEYDTIDLYEELKKVKKKQI